MSERGQGAHTWKPLGARYSTQTRLAFSLSWALTLPPFSEALSVRKTQGSFWSQGLGIKTTQKQSVKPHRLLPSVDK